MTTPPLSTEVSYGIGITRTLTAVVVIGLFLSWNHLAQKAGSVPYSTPIRLSVSANMTPSGPDQLLPEPVGPIKKIHLGFVGDIMQHRAQADDDFRACYREIRPLVEGFDLAVGNLEFPVDPRKPLGPPARSVQFNGSQEHVAALAEAGFDVLSTANNHSFDQDLEGALATINVLRSHGIIPVGTGSEPSQCEPVLVPCQGLRIAFVAYTIRPNSYCVEGELAPWPRDWPINELNFSDWSNEYRRKGLALFRQHAEAADRMGADFLIALVHWGEEWHFGPTNDQRQAARDMLDAGFDLVVGGHSHVINPAEVEQGRLVAYSLGNFISDFQELEPRLGAVLEVTVASTGKQRPRVIDFHHYPILTRRQGHVVSPVRPDGSPEERQAWQLAEKILGPSLPAWPTSDLRPAESFAHHAPKTEK